MGHCVLMLSCTLDAQQYLGCSQPPNPVSAPPLSSPRLTTCLTALLASAMQPRWPSSSSLLPSPSSSPTPPRVQSATPSAACSSRDSQQAAPTAPAPTAASASAATAVAATAKASADPSACPMQRWSRCCEPAAWRMLPCLQVPLALRLPALQPCRDPADRQAALLAAPLAVLLAAAAVRCGWAVQAWQRRSAFWMLRWHVWAQPAR